MGKASPVEQYAALGKEVPYRPKEEIKAELTAITSARESLYSVELHEAQKLDAQAHKLRRDMQFAGTTYKRLSLEPLKWARWQEAPIFAIYSLYEPTMSICHPESWEVRNTGASWMNVKLPQPIRDIYYKHAVNLRRDIRFTSTFQGIIPKSVKEGIEVAKPMFTLDGGSSKTNIFLIGEGQWVRNQMEPEPLRRFDPLVVGWDGEELWLINHFNLTPLERYVIEEFPALPAGTEQMALPAKSIVEKEL